MVAVREHAPGHWIGLILLILIIVGIGVLVWQNDRSRLRPQRAGHDPAVAELRLRYARGDISREEYIERSADLGGGRT
jgi:uncharacterized membrane protein